MADWVYYIRAMWAGDGRGALLHDGALLGLFAAVLCFAVWFVRRILRRDRARGFEPVRRDTATRR